MSDNNIVVTVSGPAMAGKSVILVEIAEALKARGIDAQIDLKGSSGFEEGPLIFTQPERDRRIDIIKSNGFTVTLEEKQTARPKVDA